MKTPICILGVVAAFCLMVYAAGDYPTVSLGNCNSTVTNSVTTTAPAYRGFLDSIYFKVTATSPFTGTVAVATSRETVLTVTGFTNDIVRRPRVAPCDATGTSVASTNERVYLSEEALTFTVTSTSTGLANSVTAAVRVTDN